MLTIKNLIESATCNWCGKEKEVCEVRTENGRIVRLCWNDLKRTVRMQTLTTESDDEPDKV
jgi:hypothetical protein